MEIEREIIRYVCGDDQDPNHCTMLVKQYWPKVSNAMFTNATAKMVCEGLEYCDMIR